MKKIVTLNVKQLRTEECFGYLKLVLAETENLPEEETPSILTTSVNTYTDKFNGYDTALKASAVNPATVSVTATDAGRDDSWRGANAYVKAMCNHPTAEVANAAAEVKSLFDKYGDPTSLAQTEESGVLHNLLQDLEAFDASKRTLLNLDVWRMDYRLEDERRSVPCRSRRAHGSRCSPSGGHRERNAHRSRSRLPLVGRYGQCLGDDKRRYGLCHLY